MNHHIYRLDMEEVMSAKQNEKEQKRFQENVMSEETPGSPVVRDTMLSLPRAWVQLQVGELKFHKLHGGTQKIFLS